MFTFAFKVLLYVERQMSVCVRVCGQRCFRRQQWLKTL